MKLLLLVFLTTLAAGLAIGQDKSLECLACKCPNTKIEASSNQPNENDTVTFEVTIVEPKLKKCHLTYDWSVSAGEILSGNATRAIRLKIPIGSGGQNITVAVFINGDNGCENNPSETIGVRPKDH